MCEHTRSAGYGNIAPATEEGKIATIFYAIIGMPLFLLYLSNIGNKSFELFMKALLGCIRELCSDQCVNFNPCNENQ